MKGKLSGVALAHIYHSESYEKASGVGDVARSDVFLVCPKPWIQFPSPDKTAMVAHACHTSTGEVEAGSSEVHDDHPQLHETLL